jgi:NIMA (never in mitosis gene a)-related kinase
MITEFAEGGDLSTFINLYRKKKQIIPEEEIWRLSIQMLYGLKYLHKKNIFHRDIKSANIFLTKNFQ